MKTRDRYDSKRYKSMERNVCQAHVVPEIPRANENEYSADELQMGCGVTEYEVPVQQKGTKLALYDST